MNIAGKSLFRIWLCSISWRCC